MTVTPRPRQRSEFVVWTTPAEHHAVYRGESARRTRTVANAYPDAVITFRSRDGVDRYLAGRD